MRSRTSPQDLVACFRDTWAFANSPAISGLTEAAAKRSRVYREGFTSEKSGTADPAARVRIVEQSSFEAARELCPAGRTAVLNFANPVEPGGGVLRGATAQEESLCRCSNLYPCLLTEAAQADYYEYHRALGGHVFTDRLIYTRDVLVFKDEEELPQMLPESERFRVDIITCAAPYSQSVRVDPERLARIFRSRIRNILEAAVDNDAAVLILGAFGCGAFGNDPVLVAEAFRDVLRDGGYERRIQQIVFAVKRSRSGVSRNLLAFRACCES